MTKSAKQIHLESMVEDWPMEEKTTELPPEVETLDEIFSFEGLGKGNIEGRVRKAFTQEIARGEERFLRGLFKEEFGDFLAQKIKEGYEKGQQDALNGIHPPLEKKIKRMLDYARKEERSTLLQQVREIVGSLEAEYHRETLLVVLSKLEDLENE